MQKFASLLLVSLFAAGVVFSQDMPTDGLVAYYKFDDDGEMVIEDHSGNGLIGEIVGDAIYVEGIKGTALWFNGIDAYVNCYAMPDFDIDTEVTLMAWVKPYDIGNGEHNPYIAKGDHSYALKQHTSTTLEFFIYDSGWNSARAIMDSSWNDKWHHFAGTYDGIELKAYVNGELDSITAHSGPIALSTHELHLAHNSEHTDRLYEGILDECAIFNIALSEEQIKAIYDSYEVSSVEDQKSAPVADFALKQNYPNPFNPETRISFSLARDELVTIKVYDVLGHEVATLVDEQKSAGIHSVRFDASGKASGVYYYKMLVGNQFVDAKKMLLVR
jgi:hypothetical protein